MTEQLPRILVIDDDPELLQGFLIELEFFEEYELYGAEGIIEARELLGDVEFDVILTDLRLHTAEEGGLTILNEVKDNYPDTQVIIFTGFGSTLFAAKPNV